MASKPIFRDRRMPLLLHPLLLLLTPREFILTWTPAVCCVLTVLPPVTVMWIESKSQKHRHVLTFTLNIFFGADITQCEAVFCNHCFAERFGPKICCSQPLRSDFILHLSVDNVFGGLRINDQRWLHLVTLILQQRHNSFRLRRSQCCSRKLCVCAASRNDLFACA